MARIEVTEESLRDQVDEDVFEQSLAWAEDVTGLQVSGLRIEAAVDGVAVSVRVLPYGIDARCGCGRPGPCAHAVAAVLAWVRAGEVDGDEVDGDVADGDEVDGDEAEGDLGGDLEDEVADLRDELDEVLDELADEARRYSREWHPDTGEWHPDTEDLEDLLDEADELSEDEPDAVRELAEHVIGRIEQVLDIGNYHGDELPDALVRAEDLHLDACRAGSPDPVLLAEYLVGRMLHSGWDSPDSIFPEYADVLGPAGLGRCRELLEQADGTEAEVRELREVVAQVIGR